MANEFVAKNGLISQNNSVVNGSFTVIGNQTITGSLIQGLEGNIATGDQSHAEGSITQAIGNYSHAEGDNTRAIGNYSHAEGLETIASGSWSHAEGYRTIASANYQHVQGQWNVTSSVDSAFIVGNGTDANNRSNLIYAAGNEVQISGSLIATSLIGSFTGSLLGTASYAANGGVTQLIAGPNITLSPTNGLGQVTISSTGGGGSSFNTATGSYGSFYDTTTQTNPVGNVPRSMSLNTTAITNGVSVSGSTNPFNTYIKTENAGIYNIQFSAQLDKTDSGNDEVVIWLRKNGIDLIDTATTITLQGNNDKQVAAWNWFVTSAANDYYQIIWYSLDTDVRLLAEGTGGGHPGIPSVIVTANRVDQFLSNTGSFSGSFTGQFTGSLLGTASQANNAVTASYVLNAISSSFSATASYALTSAGGGGGGFPFSGSGVITGSLLISGSGLTVTGSLNMLGPIIYPIITQTNNYTLQLSDAGDIVEMNVGTANTVTVPSSSVTNFSTGTQITLVQYGAGQTTVTTGSTNVLLRSAGNATKIAAQYGGATLIKRGTDEWYLLGNITV